MVVLMLVAAMSVSSSAAETKKYKDGDVLFEQDFSGDLAALQALPGYSAHGYSYTDGQGVLTVKDGKLNITVQPKDSKGAVLGGRYATRVNLYTIPEDVDRFSISVDLKINSYTGTELSSAGPSVILADSHDTDTNAQGTNSKFSMIWLRTPDKATSGAYTYGDTAKNKVQMNRDGIGNPGDSYTVKVYVDLNTRSGAFNIENKDKQVTYEELDFYYNTCDLLKNIGLGANATDVDFDNFKVYYGDGVFDGMFAETVETDPPATTKAPDATKAPEATNGTDGGTDDGEKTEEGGNTGLIIGIVAAVVVVAAVVIVVVSKKKKK